MPRTCRSRRRRWKSVYDWTGFYCRRPFRLWRRQPWARHQSAARAGLAVSRQRDRPDRRLPDRRQPRSSPTASCSASRRMSTFTSPLDHSAFGRMPPVPFNSTIDYIGTARGRIGYAFDRVMPYLTGGFAWGHAHVDINDGSGAARRLHAIWLDRRRRRRVCGQRQLERKARIRICRPEPAAPTILSNFLLARRHHRSAHPSAQVRAELSPRRRAVKSGAARAAIFARVRRVERTCADDVPAAGLSRAFVRPMPAQQPAGGAHSSRHGPPPHSSA